MSDEHIITKVKKEKDPRKVEAGKRLGALSKAAKERRAMERAHAEGGDTTNDTNNSGPGYMSVVMGVGVITGLVGLYFMYKQDKRATAAKETEPNVTQKQSPVQKPVNNRLYSLDD